VNSAHDGYGKPERLLKRSGSCGHRDQSGSQVRIFRRGKPEKGLHAAIGGRSDGIDRERRDDAMGQSCNAESGSGTEAAGAFNGKSIAAAGSLKNRK
jgi:hypothetical protein